MKQISLNLKATLDPHIFEKNFRRLFVSGRISDYDLDRRIIRLSRLFKVFATTCHLPLWTRGLIVTNEISRVTDNYLEFSSIRSSLLCLVKKSLQGICVPPPLLSKADWWVELLDMLKLQNEFANPATLVMHLAENSSERLKFLFSLYLPEQFGGSFGRYPGQLMFIRHWLKAQYSDWSGPISCLDAACGSGEGSYELAGLLMDSGFDSSRIRITGVTLNPLEVFAAAHAYFPHNPKRELQYRECVKSLVGIGPFPQINFQTADLQDWETLERYKIVICNGILGGPLIHENKVVENVILRLVGSMHAGGVLLAADRFHGGWKKVFPKEHLETLFKECGLELLPVSEGVAGLCR